MESTVILIVSVILIPLCTALFPYLQSIFQANFENRKMKQEAIIKFSKNITQTLNYFRVMNKYVCDCHEQKDEAKAKYAKKMQDDYYNKLVSIDPSYDVTSVLVKTYFSKNILDEIEKFRELISAHLRTDYRLINADNVCCLKNDFEINEKTIYDHYNRLIQLMILELKPK